VSVYQHVRACVCICASVPSCIHTHTHTHTHVCCEVSQRLMRIPGPTCRCVHASPPTRTRAHTPRTRAYTHVRMPQTKKLRRKWRTVCLMRWISRRRMAVFPSQSGGQVFVWCVCVFMCVCARRTCASLVLFNTHLPPRSYVARRWRRGQGA